jgi:3-phosphoshikimate 1-carboxyvinyltransferase
MKSQFKLGGRLPDRPMEALWTTLEAHGAKISGKGKDFTELAGPISSGIYEIPGNISSQFISGLLFALPCLTGDSEIRINGGIASAGYIQMTLDALQAFSVTIIRKAYGFYIPGGQCFVSPGEAIPEGDWSNAAFWLCAASACKDITLYGLKTKTVQGDSAVCDILRRYGAEVKQETESVTIRPGALHGITFAAEDIPDLVPALAVTAAAANGTTIIEQVGRLRLKESDRVKTVVDTLKNLGGNAECTDDMIIIHGYGRLIGGTVDACGDHRIAMMAAAASVICKEKVIITGAEAIYKSYPAFFEDFRILGGVIDKEEQT